MSKAPAKPADANAETPKKGKGKLIAIAIVAVLLLGGGGGAAWFFLLKPPPESADGEAAPAEKSKKEKKAEGPPVYVPFDPFTVNLQPDGRFLQTTFTVQVGTQEDATKMKEVLPAIRGQVLLLLSAKTDAEMLTLEGKNQLAEEIKTIAEMRHGEKTTFEILGVHFNSFILQ